MAVVTIKDLSIPHQNQIEFTDYQNTTHSLSQPSQSQSSTTSQNDISHRKLMQFEEEKLIIAYNSTQNTPSLNTQKTTQKSTRYYKDNLKISQNNNSSHSSLPIKQNWQRTNSTNSEITTFALFNTIFPSFSNNPNNTLSRSLHTSNPKVFEQPNSINTPSTYSKNTNSKGRMFSPIISDLGDLPFQRPINPGVNPNDLGDLPGARPDNPGQIPNTDSPFGNLPGNRPVNPGQTPGENSNNFGDIPGQRPINPGDIPNGPDNPFGDLPSQRPQNPGFLTGNFGNLPGQRPINPGQLPDPENPFGSLPSQRPQNPGFLTSGFGSLPGQRPDNPGQIPSPESPFGDLPGQRPENPGMFPNDFGELPGNKPLNPGQPPVPLSHEWLLLLLTLPYISIKLFRKKIIKQ